MLHIHACVSITEVCCFRNNRTQLYRRIVVFVMGIIFVGLGLSIMIVVNYHNSDAFDTCSNPSADILDDHAELYAWEHCEEKVCG